MVTKQGLSVSDHREFGKKLNRIYRELLDMEVRIGNAERINSRAYINVNKARGKVEILKVNLDDLFALRFRNEYDTEVYYPPKGQTENE